MFWLRFKKNDFSYALLSGGRVITCYHLNSLPASGEFRPPLMIFTNCLDPGQARRFVGPDLDPSCLSLMLFLKKSNVGKISVDNNKSMKNYPACKE